MVPQSIERGWLERHPGWKIPLGGLCILLFGVVCSIPGLFIAQRAIQSSGAYQESLAMAQSDPAVTELLGKGWRAGSWTWGRYKSGPNSGYADLAIPVSGPRQSGKMEIVARKSGDRWVFKKVCLTVSDNRQALDLLQPPPAQP